MRSLARADKLICAAVDGDAARPGQPGDEPVERHRHASPAIALMVVAMMVVVGITLRVQSLEAGRSKRPTIERSVVGRPAPAHAAGGRAEEGGSHADTWAADDCPSGTRPDFAH